MGPKAPVRNELRAGIIVPAVLAALLALPAAAGAQPQPDAAPQAPAVAPDPAPGSASDPAPPTEQPAETPPPPAESSPPAPTPVQQPAAPQLEAEQAKAKPKAAGNRRRAAVPRSQGNGEVAAARASSLVRIKSLLPDSRTAADSSSHLVLIAAGALLALVLASGSMLSVASRAVKWR